MRKLTFCIFFVKDFAAEIAYQLKKMESYLQVKTAFSKMGIFKKFKT